MIRLPCVVPLLIVLLASPASRAEVLTLPGAGPVAAVRDTLVRDGFEQTVRLSGGDGGNAARIGVRTDSADLVLAFPTDLSKPTELGIQGELRARFPGQTLRVVAPRRNAYGPVGMAVGTDCLYAWQWIELGPAMTAVVGPGLFGGLSAPYPRAAASIRIRLCRTERATLSDLIGAVERMTLDLARAPRARGGITPFASSAPPRRIVARRRSIAVARAALSAPSRQERPVASSMAPRPDTAGRRYLAGPETIPRSTSPSVSAEPSSPFIADPRPPIDTTKPQSAPGAVGAGSPNYDFQSDLPVQAYRPSKPSGR